MKTIKIYRKGKPTPQDTADMIVELFEPIEIGALIDKMNAANPRRTVTFATLGDELEAIADAALHDGWPEDCARIEVVYSE